MSEKLNLSRAVAVGALGLGGLASLAACGVDEATYEDVYLRATCPEGSELFVPGFINRAANIGTGAVHLDCLESDGSEVTMLGTELLPSDEGANVKITISYYDGSFDEGRPQIIAVPNLVTFKGSADIESAQILLEPTENSDG